MPEAQPAIISRIQKSPQYAEEALRSEISEVIYEAMEVAGISKAELARRLQTSRANVTQMLQGNNNFEVATLAKIGYALGVSWKLVQVERGKP